MQKEGFFEWIGDFAQLEPHIVIAQDALVKSLPELQDKALERVLEVGCGTSTLSQSLSVDMGFGTVVAIDNDADCIAHMQRTFPPSTVKPPQRVVYYCYDMTETATAENKNKQENELDDDQSFHLVIDKGTFDAILVEGSVSSMVLNILRLLALHGVYLLFSINKSLLLQELFEFAPLGLKIVHQSTVVISNQEITVLALQKEFQTTLTVDEIADHEREVMDLFFQIEKPLLTKDEVKRIRDAFAAQGSEGEGEGVSLVVAYKILFGHRDDLGYEYSLFLEDVDSFSLQVPEKMNVEEALKFVQLMQ